MLWHRAHPGQNRLWHLPPYPGESDRLLAGALYQPSPRTRPDEHRPLRRLKLANPVVSIAGRDRGVGSGRRAADLAITVISPGYKGSVRADGHAVTPSGRNGGVASDGW